MFTTVCGESLYYESRGEGFPLVFIHGLGGVGSIYFPIAQGLSGTYRTVLYDWLGSGASARPHRPYSVETWAEEAKSLCEGLGVKSAAFIGHSLGAAVAVTVAARCPDLTRAIALLGPVTKLPETAAGAIRDRAAKVRAEGMGPLADALPNGALAPATRESNPALHALFRAMILANDPECYALHCEALLEADATPLIQRVKCPALLLAGDSDPTAPPPAVEGLARKFSAARFALVAKAGHAMQLDQPAAVQESLRSFFDATL
jgi:pimeloyl-ACP methyl ester carboxylesterase